MRESPETDHARIKDTAIIYDQAQTIARLERKIADGPLRPGLENDDPEVIACMGSVPACQQAGCQARVLMERIEVVRDEIGQCAVNSFKAANRQPARSKARALFNVEGDAYAFAGVKLTSLLSAFLKEL
jgi:hypothetical protein